MKFDNSLEQVYLSDLQDLYDAEKQLVKALPKLARSVSSPKLSQGFQRHAKQTQEHAKRLEKIFQQHQLKSKGRRCPAMAGLIAEANETLEEDFSEQLLDVGVITAAQKVEHYEMSAYTSAIALAQALDFEADVRLLERTLREEEETERQLSTLCENIVQQQQRSEGSWTWQGEQTSRGTRGGGRKASQQGSRATRGNQARSGSGQARATRNHDEIRRWAEERDGAPASVRGTAKGGATGLLRIDFPGYSGERTLQHISWNEWFDKFDEENLQFLYQDRTKDGKESRFFKLVCEPKTRRATATR